MPLTSNYIKVKSTRQLRRENRDSFQVLHQAGSQDLENQPGGTNVRSLIRELTGVQQPQSFVEGLGSLGGLPASEHGSFPLSSSAGGSILNQPALIAREVLNSNSPNPPFPWDQRGRQRRMLAEPISNILPGGVTAGINEIQPGGVYFSGNMQKELNRTTGKDANRPVRTRDRRRANMAKRDL